MFANFKIPTLQNDMKLVVWKHIDGPNFEQNFDRPKNGVIAIFIVLQQGIIINLIQIVAFAFPKMDSRCSLSSAEENRKSHKSDDGFHIHNQSPDIQGNGYHAATGDSV